ncbi:nicotinate-nucleotide diphosphorylase (carboxylating), partial [Flavobacteriaceae bacterium]|nr:nicotinate-nucleotide diphosphorylase (carboxylating) [Flavobacteriaceae bacterium]
MPSYFLQQYKNNINHFIDEALKEDIGLGDHSGQSCIPKEAESTAKLLVKEEGILAGIELAEILFIR